LTIREVYKAFNRTWNAGGFHNYNNKLISSASITAKNNVFSGSDIYCRRMCRDSFTLNMFPVPAAKGCGT